MTDKPNPLDKYLAPGWREDAAEAGECWRKTFQTPSAQTLEARQRTAYIKMMGGEDKDWKPID